MYKAYKELSLDHLETYFGWLEAKIRRLSCGHGYLQHLCLASETVVLAVVNSTNYADKELHTYRKNSPVNIGYLLLSIGCRLCQ